MDSLRLILLLSTGYFLNVTQDQVPVPTQHPELIAGPWESESTSGIDGIFFNIETSSVGPAGHQQIAWQTINIRVYHRQDRKESWGWFGIQNKASSESHNMQDGPSFELFDGEHLRIHCPDTADLKPFDLDIRFVENAQVWTGTWSRSGQVSNVVLERPSTGGNLVPSGFVGDWNGEPDSHADGPGSLHIRESRDGFLSAWLERASSAIDPKTMAVHSDQHNSEFLRVYSMSGTGLILETLAGIGPTYRYRGSLSEDRQLLTGRWTGGSGGTLSAPEKFRRAL